MSKFQQHIKYLKYSLDPSAFMKDILNWECTDFHKEWFDFMVNNKKTVLLAPRSHGKTTTLIAYLIWKILVNPDIRMLYMTIKEDKAMEVSDKIMYQLSSNEKLIDTFGEQKGDLWSRRAFNVKNRKHSSANRAPTFTACGIESREIGAHFDLIALDDIVDKENTNTQHRMDNLKETFDSVIDYMLEPNGEIHVIGTRWRENDLYSNLKEYTDFKFRRYQGIIQWEDKEKGIPGKSLWPERYPYEELAKKLKDKGAYLFYLQTQNEVISQEHAMFKSEFMNNEFDLSNIDISSLKRYMGIDLASSTGKDYFTIVTIGLDKNGIIYILDAFRGKLGINQQLEKVKEKDELWKPIKIGVESNSYQAAFSTELLTTTALPIVPVNVKRSKIDRAQRAATLLEAGRIYFRRSGMDELKKELAFFPNGKNDDLVDALTMAINIIDTKRFNSTWSDVADAIWAGNVSSKVNTTNLELI